MNTWALITGLVVTTALIKAAGPVLVGGRELPPVVLRIVGLVAPAVVAALVVTTVFAEGQELRAGADTVGVAVATVLLVRRVPLVVAMLVAVLVTAGLRAL